MNRVRIAYHVLVLTLAIAGLVLGVIAVRAEPGGATRNGFAFAGRLTPPQPGSHNFTFTFRAEGSTSSCPVMVNDVTVDDEGEFEATIPLDTCTSALFDGTDVVMDIAVDGAVITPDLAIDGAFPIHPVPYARYADRVGVPECPPTYARDQSDISIVLCTRSDGDQMVRVGPIMGRSGPSPFWIDRFEAGNCLPLGAGGGPDGQGTTRAACSMPGLGPSNDVSWFQAAMMCTNGGKRLCTNYEWQVAAQATTDGTPCILSGAVQPPDPARRCYSSWGALDMVGNVQEWVADWIPGGRSTGSGNETVNWPGGDGDAVVSFDSYVSLDGSPGMNGFPGALIRGGHAGLPAGQAGVFYVSAEAAPTNLASGFRCCAGP